MLFALHFKTLWFLFLECCFAALGGGDSCLTFSYINHVVHPKLLLCHRMFSMLSSNFVKKLLDNFIYVFLSLIIVKAMYVSAFGDFVE